MSNNKLLTLKTLKMSAMINSQEKEIEFLKKNAVAQEIRIKDLETLVNKMLMITNYEPQPNQPSLIPPYIVGLNGVMGKNMKDINLFVFHQANKFMLEFIRKKIGIDEDLFFYFLENCGNTVSSTIPIALKEAINQNKIKDGDTLLLAGFGVGYSWGGCLLTKI